MADSRILRVAAVGWEVEKADVQQNLLKAEGLIEHASENRADAIGFVEYFSTLGTGVDTASTAELPGEGTVTQWAIEMAGKYDIEIWCPFIELDQQGRKYNAVGIVDPNDGIVSTHHEFHYFTLEQKGMNVGEGLDVVHRPWGTLGCFICFDIHYPEVSRVLAMRGADVVFWPTLSVGPWSIEALRKKAAVRCMDNGFWLVESNTAAPPPYAPYAGQSRPGSCVIDPEGNVVASTGYRPGVVFVDIDLERRSYGTGIIGAGNEQDLRRGFQDWLRPDYYASEYGSFPIGQSPSPNL